MIKRNCDVCGQPYEAQRSTSKYCTPRCRKVAHLKVEDTDLATGRTSEISIVKRAVSKVAQAIGMKVCKKCKSPMVGSRCLQKGCF